MTDAVESMAYAKSGGVPWHGLGFPVEGKMTPKAMQKAAKLDWHVEKRPLIFKGKGEKLITVPGKFALVRDKDDKHLSVVGSTYKPVQNDQSVEFFSKFVKAGHMEMETMGSLHDGQYIWALARLGKDFKIAGVDEVRGYLLLCNPHIIGKAMVIQFTPIRVVCWNTLNFALGSSLRGDKTAFRMPHSIAFSDTVRERAEIALGLGTAQMDEFKDVSNLLAKKRAKDKDVQDFFADVLRWDPKKAVEAAKAKAAKAKAKAETDAPDAGAAPRMLKKFTAALTHSPGATLKTAQGTWWGALNAVSYVVDHEVGRDQSASLRTAWMGAKAALKRRAVELALSRAK